MTTPMLQFESIDKAFFGVPALRSVSLSIAAGSVMGLVGENGAGKSTLMNILGGVFPADAGRMRCQGDVYRPADPADAKQQGIAFIHQELNLFTNLSILDNLFIDGFPRRGKIPLMDLRRARRSVETTLASVGLALSPKTPVETLTPGERQLLEIGRALSRNARIIIFDEPTTSLTSQESQRLFAMIEDLRKQGRTIIYISHNLDDVLRLADEVAILRDGCLVESGPAREYTSDRLIARMVGRDITQRFPRRVGRRNSDARLEIRGITQRGVLHDVSFSLHGGEILGVFGLMGSGRTELARVLFGMDPCQSGSIRIEGKVFCPKRPHDSISRGMAFVTEDRRKEGLLMEASVYDNLALVRLRGGGKENPRRQQPFGQAVEQVASSLKIKVRRLDRDVAKHLSGGNQQKVVIGKWLLMDPAILILDEPTRGIDVGAKVEIYGLINEMADRGTAVLCISSELEELIGISDRILVMGNGEIQGRFERAQFDQEQILQAAFKGQRTHAVVPGGGS